MQPHPSFHNFLRFAWDHSPFYRRLYQAHGIRADDLDQVALQDLPVVTKHMVLDNFDEIVTDARVHRADIEAWLENNPDPRSRFLKEYLVLRSSGSSGTKASILYDEVAWRSMTTAAAAVLSPGNLAVGTRYRNAFYIGAREHTVSNTTALNSSQTVIDSLVLTMTDPGVETIARLNAFQPDRLTSYASSLAWLADLALAGKLKIAPRHVLTSSDRMTPAIEAKIREAWNPAIYDVYAAAESIFMAIKQPGQTDWKVFDELQTVEVLGADNQPVKTGEIGRTVLSQWTNRAIPLIRYDLTDYAICGETEPGNTTLRGFVGRSVENLPIRLDNGQTSEIPSFALANIGTPGLETFQFISSSPDEVELQYCAQADLTEALTAEIARLQAAWGGQRTKFSFQRVDHLWNDAATHKLKLVREPNEAQIGLPTQVLRPGSIIVDPHDHLRPGGGFKPFSRDLLEGSIAAVFERQAASRSKAIAIKEGPHSLTYFELNQAANRVAHALQSRQMDPAHPVVLLFNHKAAMVFGMLGVLKAGGWYAPLDPAHPAARNTSILHEIGAQLVVTDSESLAAARGYGFAAEQIINVDQPGAGLDDSNLERSIPASAPACVLYTSGSTGRPKGVVLDQRAVLHRAMLYTNDYAIGPDDRLALLQSYVFNASVREIYAALLNGAGLYIYSLKRDGISHLAAWLEAESVTLLYMVPSTWRAFLETLKDETFGALRLVRLGGEAILARDVEGFQRHFGPGCLLANGLASTETGTISQYFMDHQTRITLGSAPAGYAVQDKDISLLDETGCPVENGSVGEIVVSSAYMGPGYFSPDAPPAIPNPPRDAAPTRAVHTGDLGYRMPDGRIMLVGRKDWQVKLRGQRINLLEIEQALLSLENVAEAAVTLQPGADGIPFLAAYIQPKSQPAPGEDVLRRGLRRLLPEVMVPAVFVFCDPLPLTVTGKVDHQALPAAPHGSIPHRTRALTAPETPTEQALAEIWRELLGIKDLDVEDSFFDLGGESLQALAMMAQIEVRFKRKFPLSVLFQQDTLRGLARAIAEAGDAGTHGPLVTIQPLGDRPPVFFIPGLAGDPLSLRRLAANLGPEHPQYGLHITDYGDSARNFKTIEQAAGQCVSAIKSVQPNPPYALVGYSFGGHLAIETARLLTAQDGSEPLVVLIDTFPPVPLRSTTPFKRARIHLNNLSKLKGTRQVLSYLRDRVRIIYLRLFRYEPARKIATTLGAPARAPDSSARIALAVYKPEPYPGKVVLFKAKERKLYLDWDPMEPWNDFISGEMEVRILPGEHNNLIKNPYAIEVARQLHEVIDHWAQHPAG